MNNLNSVLIEGMIVMNPEYTKSKNGVTEGMFTIQSNRFYKKNDEVEKESCRFNIIMNGKLAENIKQFLIIESHVRVVGRLSGENGSITIIAEHIEFKKTNKKPKDGNEGSKK